MNLPCFLADDADNYIAEWTEQHGQINSFVWVLLWKCPQWEDIKKSMNEIAAKNPSFDINRNSSMIFEQYGYIKNYCSAEKIEEWRSKNVEIGDRWVEIFKHMEAEHVPYTEFSLIIEFALCLPGSNAPVERVFSHVKNIWTQECASLHISTLRSILFVKLNIEYNCIDFYHFLKTQPQLLRKIAGAEKYKKANEEASTSAMSIENDEF